MKMTRLGCLIAATGILAACSGGTTAGSTTNAGGSASSSTAGSSSSVAGTTSRGGATSAGGATNASAGATTTTMVGTGGTGGATASGGAAGSPAVGGGSSYTGTGLHSVGTHFEDKGKTVRLIGWNRPGAEYSCIADKMPSVLDGPTDAASVQSMQSWKGFNTVRVPLNETCWLGINGVNGGTSGSSYVNAIANYVSLFRAKGIYVILDMHWNAPGGFVASSQMPMADADHSLEFWKRVATQFKNDPGIIFDLYNEPHLNSVPMGGFVAGTNSADAWACWLNGGCTITPQTWEQQTGGYAVAGMQAMLDAVRGTGATNLVLAGGLNWSGDLSGWAAHAPHDSADNLAASAHIYFKPTVCMAEKCYSTVQDFSKATQVPIVTGELGEFDCAHGLIDPYLAWADTSGVSYLAWSWSLEPCGSTDYTAGPSLISDWNGTPTAYGQGFKDHLNGL